MAAESIPHLTNLPKSRTRQSFFPYSSSSLINILSVTAWALSHKSSPERTYYYCSARVDIKNKHHYSYFLRPELSQIVCKYCPYQPKYVPLSNLSLKHLLLHLAFFLLINTNMVYRDHISVMCQIHLSFYIFKYIATIFIER